MFTMKLLRTTNLIIISRLSSSSTSRRNTKKKNHYENLEIKFDATHNEIKSAYFKLSKQYHPDMNKSAEAKLKFNDIATAYETLGNHGKRKQYDRGLRISTDFHGEQNVTMNKTNFESLHKEAERVHSEILRNRTQGDGAPVYNFDEWTERHYGNLFEKRQKDISRAKYYTNQRENDKKAEMPPWAEMPAISVFILTVIVIYCMRLQISDLDNPIDTLKYQEVIRNNDSVRKAGIDIRTE